MTEAELNKLFEEFPLWVKTKDPHEAYDYISNTNCPFAQYLTSLGYQGISVGSNVFTINRDIDGVSSETHHISRVIADALYMPHGYAHTGHRTFGMLAASFPDGMRVAQFPLVAGNL